jgi:hypothetical protein
MTRRFYARIGSTNRRRFLTRLAPRHNGPIPWWADECDLSSSLIATSSPIHFLRRIDLEKARLERSPSWTAPTLPPHFNPKRKRGTLFR